MQSAVWERIERELATGERLLWSGQPRERPRLDVGLAVVIVFLLGWTGFAGNAARKAVAEDGLGSDALIPMGFALVGLLGLAFVLFVSPRFERNTFYGLTDQRVLIVSGLIRREVDRLPLQAMTRVVLREQRDGGTIMFEDFSRQCGEDQCAPKFSRIDDARSVYHLIEEARAVAQRQGRSDEWR